MVKRIVILLLAVIFLLGLPGLLGCSANPANDVQAAQSGTSTSSTTSTPGDYTIPEVVSIARPSVVSINVQLTTYDFFNRPIKEQGAGSGWVFTSDGYIVTNNHVVENADNVTITLENGKVYQAASIKTDPLTDLAVVKINDTGLKPLSTGNTMNALVGDGVVAIGNALGQGISATAGIISGLNVSLDASQGQTLLGLVQTDAAINPGNSGGPLVNMKGQVIGINSIKIAQVGVEGMGYAISIEQALPIINTLISKGIIIRPYLGVSSTDVNTMIASLYGLSVNQGVLITNVASGSPANNAGLQQGDVITNVDGTDIISNGDLIKLIDSYDIGTTITVTYWRGSNKATVKIKLAETPSASGSA